MKGVERSREYTPYVGFPIVYSCCFECTYCEPGGEAAPSESVKVADLDMVLETAKMAHEMGSRKFRITGGEPFIHPQLGTMLYELSKLPETEITVNSSGVPLKNRQGILDNTPENVRFIISLDAMEEDIFNMIRPSKYPNAHEMVKESARNLADRDILKRINVVVTHQNKSQIPAIIDFCRELGCDLKVSDIAENSDQFATFGQIYSPIDEVEKTLGEIATDVVEHGYSYEFGIPSKIYNVDGVNVTIKNSKNGARYNLDEECGTCEHFPCNEGLYFISSLPDGSFSGCRFDKVHVATSNRREGLEIMMRKLKEAKLIMRED